MSGRSLCRPTSGSGTITIVGNSATPGNCIMTSNTQGFSGSGSYTIDGFRTLCTGNGFAAAPGAQWRLQNIDHGPTSGDHMSVDRGLLIITGAHYISGGAIAHILAINGAFIQVPGGSSNPTLNVLVSPTFTAAFLQITLGANCGLVYTSVTNGGNAVGKRYLLSMGGIINLVGGSASAFPGNADGVNSGGFIG